MIGKDNEKKHVSRSKAHETSQTMHAYIKGPLSRCENVSKAIRKKGYNTHVRLNGLAMDYIYQKRDKGIWLTEMMATHPATMVSNIVPL